MNARDSTCRNIVVTAELVQCLNQALKASDTKLNQTYAQVKSLLSPEDRRALTHAQQLWIQYRDANCKAEYNLYGGGSGGPPTHLACLEAETRARDASLKRSFGWLQEKAGS
ncbi:MAG: DUF1311 domain-containing protein [Rudaea sp.]|uniref:lysozyme inhibitor LprI family protein n=1 Tax=unclassified Rudaea TaxID=2627037 RepID=UPI0014855922|nr:MULTISPECIES: lysozyme inhibitor LprI family protein [unclassified Rudaea]MBN8885699.1 DUF1311 domain-containing protein [Rudaea sp.]MBR0345050.1 DUF1311 domain-containing protein [Rudaea sp.]